MSVVTVSPSLYPNSIAGAPSSTHPGTCWFITDCSGEKGLKITFQLASYLMDPACKVHEYFRRLYIVDILNPQGHPLANFARRVALCAGIVLFTLIALLTTIPGLIVRGVAALCMKDNFVYMKGNGKQIDALPDNREIRQYCANVAGVPGGYAISDAGGLPLPDRIKKVADLILEQNADVICLEELFDTRTVFHLYELMKDRYAHFYLMLGAKNLGGPSGLFMASNYKIENTEFTPFKWDHLLGRTKLSSKGFFTADLSGTPVTIIPTHLQDSAHAASPTAEEIEARANEMSEIVKKVEEKKWDEARGIKRTVVMTGDFNMVDSEFEGAAWRSRFKKEVRYIVEGVEKFTYPGDMYSKTHIVGKPEEVSKDLNVDHTMLYDNETATITTSLVEVGHDPHTISYESAGDHNGLLTVIKILPI